ncbi:hypothetical protein TNCV_1316381 [Trichonephila clavipes]|nr:hypothetical protein TNCV_1316381 [Trichonephila clavipes]
MHLLSVLPLNWGGTEPNSTVTCMVLKATANDRRRTAHCHDESSIWPLPIRLRYPSYHVYLAAILQQDNSDPHTPHISLSYHRVVDTLPWPTRSPDLSPIEHVCDMECRPVMMKTCPLSVIAINSSPDGLLGTWSELVSDVPAYCLQAPKLNWD